MHTRAPSSTRPGRRVILRAASVAIAVVNIVASHHLVAAAENFNYRVGRAIRDVTGPPLDVQMWGFVREGQTTQGIHLRLWARTIIIAEPADNGARVALVTADLGSIPHPVKQSVVERLRENFGDTYRHDNVVIAATHTHAGPGGYSPVSAGSPLVSTFHREHFQKIVDAIYDSIVAADRDLQPGNVYVAAGRLENAGAQRSRTAYENNPASERARYDADTDQQMTLLKVVDESGGIATINWFALHPTSMTYNNRLISGDHKGYASAAWEMLEKTTYDRPDDFVAAFAQTNCGDVTPNLNLDNTGPGANDFESTQILGERQLAKARALADSATERLEGPIASHHRYVDFSNLEIADRFTSAGAQHTSPSAYGYAFAAGSTEDGGGHPLFREGMTKREKHIDALVGMAFKVPAPSDELRAAHAPKAILFAPGAVTPKPLQSQVQPLGLVRIGQLALIVGPAEFTTMAGRRIRATVADVLGSDVTHHVIAGYANSYAGYVTTKEEYETQQYEGGHTLFGPWTLAAYQQEYARLAADLATPSASDTTATPGEDWRTAENQPLAAASDASPANASLGDVAAPPHEAYRVGEIVTVSFWAANPNRAFATNSTYFTVEQQQETGDWATIATDRDWQTKSVWAPSDSAKTNTAQAATESDAATTSAAPLKLTISWAIPTDTPAGTYRIVYHAIAQATATESPKELRTASRTFRIQ